MAYSASNPPTRIGGQVGGQQVWSYIDGDAKATVVGAGYITNALQLGMKVGDILLGFDTTTPGGYAMCVLTFTGSAANLGYLAVA